MVAFSKGRVNGFRGEGRRHAGQTRSLTPAASPPGLLDTLLAFEAKLRQAWGPRRKEDSLATDADTFVQVFIRVPVSARLPKGYVSVDDAARYLGVSAQSVRRWVNDGQLKYHVAAGGRYPGGWRYLIPTSELNRRRRLTRKGQE